MNVIVNKGIGLCNGCIKLEEQDRTLNIQAATALDRIDTVVLRLNDNDAYRTCDFDVLTGTPSTNPVRPDLTRNESVWEIGLADLLISANSTQISNARITDTRLDTERCGVMNSIAEFDTTALYLQIQTDLAEFKEVNEAEFNEWFEYIRDILDESTAGHLQNEIGTLPNLLTETKSSLVEAINEIYTTMKPCFVRVNCDEAFAGDLITAVNGTESHSKIVPNEAPFVVEFAVKEIGNWTITDENTDTATSVTVTNYTIYNVDLNSWGYRAWLDAAGITTQFSSLAEVLADQPTVRILMNKHASVDYLVEWLNADTDTQDTFLASENALKWIGLRDYAYDTITSSVEGFLASWLDGEYWEYALKDKVPVMTANNAPYGEVLTGYYEYPWRAFDGNLTTHTECNSENVNGFITYKFNNPICVKKIKANMGNYLASNNFNVKFEGSNNNSDWYELGNVIVTGHNRGTYGEYVINSDNDDYYLYYRLYLVTKKVLDTNVYVYTLQFYGRQLSVSVPKMTSNTEPWGVAFGSSSGGNAYKYFDRDTSTGWDDDSYFGYTFNEPKIVNRLMLYTRPSYNSANKHKFQASNDGTNWIDLLSEEDMSVMTAASTYYYIDIDNNTAYTRYRVFHSGVSGFDGFKECQFYGLDYSEHEERHWIYDHGVEVESVSATNTSGGTITKTDDEIKINRVNGNVILFTDNAIGLTNYTYFGARFKTNTNYSAIGTSTSRSTTASGIDIYTQVPTTGEYEYRLNIANANENRYVGAFINNTGYLDINELWLE